ncbi:hypothetical protein EZV62_004199 [Acer yangbiense]|uniref:Uncharacterized protein n=1 Tax=Acer yangbiense TaxID=1000413 RepID=A0A5C7IK70_9ROSI|nr:hypothetical protein EZV62_004199 [Acer yangbiense]
MEVSSTSTDGGSQVEFAIQNLKQYTLGSLWADVYMCTCATFPKPTETFKVEVMKLPWSGEYKVLNDDRDLQCVFNMFRNRNLETIRIDVELQALAVAAMPLEEMDADNLAFSSSESHNNSAKRVRQSTTVDRSLPEVLPPEKKRVPAVGSNKSRSIQNASQPFTSSANPGTVAGLNIDWSVL